MCGWQTGYCAGLRTAYRVLKRITEENERKAADYAANNPLGGPACALEVMAERVKAGEDYAAVLQDYGLQHVEKKEAGQMPMTATSGSGIAKADSIEQSNVESAESVKKLLSKSDPASSPAGDDGATTAPYGGYGATMTKRKTSRN